MALDLTSAITDAADRHGLDPEFFARLVQAESGGRPDAVSPAGAIGLGQLMPGTARDLGVDPHDPMQNLDGSARYLRAQLDRFGAPDLAVAAYNAGPAAVERHGGVPPYRETQEHVRKVLGAPAAARRDEAPQRAPMAAQGEPQDLDELFSQASAGSAAPQPAGHADDDHPADLDALFAEAAGGDDGATVKRGPNGEIEININRSTNPEFLAAREADPAYRAARSDAQGRVGTTPGFVRAVSRGATYGLADELDAMLAMGETWAGGSKEYSPQQAHAAVMRANKEADDKFRTEHPWITAGGEVIGGLVAPGAREAGMFIAGAPNMAGRVARGAAAGAGAGAAYGAGTGDTMEERVLGAATGLAGGAAGGGAVPVVSAAAGKVLAPVVGAFRPDWVGKTVPMATYEAAEARLKTFGVTVADLTPEARGNLHSLLKSGVRPEDAAVEVAGLGLPIPVPFSRAQVTGSPVDQLNENLLLRGARGQRPAQEMRGFVDTQQGALRGNVDAIRGRIAGGEPMPRGAAGERASGALNDMYDTAKRGVNSAYDAARDAPGAVLPAYDAAAFVGRVRGALADFDPLSVPRVAREVDRLGALAEGKADPDLRELFAARTRMTALRKSADPVEGKAAAEAVKAFDAQIDDALTEGLFRGDASAINLWRDAIGTRREFGQRFQGNDLVEKLTAREPRSGRMQLAVDPGDASNYIFGRSNLGWVGRQNLARDLGQLRKTLGAESPEWNAIRSEAFARFAAAGEGATDGAARQFSGVKFQKSWGEAMRDDPFTMSMLFTEPERNTINQFAGVAAKATGTVKGGDNPSGTAVALQRLMRLPFLVGKASVVGTGFTQWVDESLATQAAKRMTTGPKGRKLPTKLQQQVDRIVIGGAGLGADKAGEVLLPY